METKKFKLQQTREEIISGIRAILGKHSLDEMDVTDCGSTPVIWPSADDQDFDTCTLDRVYIGKDDVLIDSSSSNSNRTDRAEVLGTDTLVNILDFLEENEKIIWRSDDKEYIVAEEYLNGETGDVDDSTILFSTYDEEEAQDYAEKHVIDDHRMTQVAIWEMEEGSCRDSWIVKKNFIDK